MKRKMKNPSAMLVTVLCCIILTACGCEHEFDNGTITSPATCTTEGVKTYTCTKCGETKEESVATIPHDYESVVTKEPTYDETGVTTYTCKVCGDSYTEEIPVKERTVIVTCIGKTNTYKDSSNWIFSNRVNLEFSLQNDCDQTVKGIQGTLLVNDMFGKKIREFTCNFTGSSIPPHETIINDSLSLDVNDYIDDHVKFFNTDYDDLEFIYTVDTLVFDDGSAPVTTQIGNNDEITVTVTNKARYPKDIHNWVFSNYALFDIAVENKTNKDIKGVSGILTIKDLFGNDIESIGCDLTGQIIPAGETVTYTGQSLEINEFNDEDVEVYMEDYSDMNFDYAVTQIVYFGDSTDDSTEA